MSGADAPLALLRDPAFLSEAAAANAQAVFKQLIGPVEEAAWDFSRSRLTRNALALAVSLRGAARRGEAHGLEASALIAARIWEALALTEGRSTTAAAIANAAILYEISGYQANAATLARQLQRRRPADPRKLENAVGLFLQRKFIELRLEQDRPLPEVVVEDELTRHLVHVGALQGMQAAATYFMSGREAAFQRAVELLEAAMDASGAVGDVTETNLIRGLRSVIPLMRERSIWQTLAHEIDHPRWRRYMRVLARGLGQPMVHSRSVSELWPSQLAALRGGLLTSDANLVIRTPTSSGKTRIAELAIVRHLLADTSARCLYVAPYRALVNEVADSFSACFTDLGVSAASLAGTFEQDDGQVAQSTQARVLVVTPEKLDLISRLSPEMMRSVALVVLDEGQIVGDGDRGRRYDLLVSRVRRLAPDARFLFLSAVVPDVTLEDFASWLRAEREPIRSGWRPSVLRAAAFVWRSGEGRLQFEEGAGLDEALDEAAPVLVREATFEHVDPQTLHVRRPRFPAANNRGQVAAALAWELVDRGPVLISTTKPAWAVSTAEAVLRRVELAQLVGDQVKAAFIRVEDRANPPTSYAAAVEWLGVDHRLTKLLARGIAVHHGPLPDPIRTAIEDDFRNRRLDVLVATSTLAQGVNLPVRTVIMHSCWRTDATSRTPISSREYWNIAGRAGRAGEETSGLLVHLVLDRGDLRDLNEYLASRTALDPVESALLNLLRDLVGQRLSPELADAAIDPAVLAMLMEEVVDPDAAVDEVLPTTLFAVQAARLGIDTAPLSNLMRNTARRIVADVPDGSARRVFASTGMSSASCLRLQEHVREHAAVYRNLLSNATLQDLEELVALVLEPLSAIPETADQSAFPGAYDDPVRLWLQGMTVSAIADTLDAPADTASELIEEFVAYRLPWGVTALWRVAGLERQIEQTSDVVRALPAMLKYGVPTPEAAWAHGAGISSRNLATLLGERFATEAATTSAAAFGEWLSTQQVEMLADEYGFAGPALREVASAVVRSRPNALIDRLDDGTLLPREVRVRLLRGVPPASLGRLIENHDPIHLVRDYDSAISRNSVLVAAGSRRLGYLPWDLAVALAPEMDGGRDVGAAARTVEVGARGPELLVQLDWQT